MQRVVAMRADSDDRVDTYEFTDEAEVALGDNGSKLVVVDKANEGSPEKPITLYLMLSHYRLVTILTTE